MMKDPCPGTGEPFRQGREGPDRPHQGLNTLAFLLPPLGAVLYLRSRRQSPRRAASLARWSWAGVGLYLAGVLLPVLALQVWP